MAPNDVCENGSAALELRCRFAYCIMLRVSDPPNTRTCHEYSWHETRAHLDFCHPDHSMLPCCSEPSEDLAGGASTPSLTTRRLARSCGSGRGNGPFQIERIFMMRNKSC